MNNNNIKIGDYYKEPLKYSDGFRFCFPIKIESEPAINACINISKNNTPHVYYEKDKVESVPPSFVENREHITQLVLEKISSLNLEISDWANKVLETYNRIKTQIEESGYAKEQEVLLGSGEKLYLSLCSYGKIKSLDDVDFFLTGSEFVDSSESLYAIAGNIVNEDKTRELIEKDKKSLFSYYKANNIDQLLSMPSDDRNDRQENTLSFFSDWYKDLYGRRPRGLNNKCQYQLDQERSNENMDYER